ncbi:MAG: ribosome-associated translation inhibitor RaiA [Clostridiales bacterium]|nr:ribosome-associated translation inhibitor RaiA [Clostridia bacterium]MCR4563653.1 ribosome-associated translation inhibitor RaiA [Clostridiales bacterium]
MNITIVGRKCTPRQSFKDRAEQKLRKVERFFGENAEAKITASVEKSAKIVEITLNKGGMIFRAQERSDDLEDALDACVDSLIRQIRKNKTKLERRLRDANIDDFFAEAEEAEDEFEIVRTKAVILKPESVEEAILQMNMLGHQFYLFNNSEDDKVSVVYRRKDGGYGLLSPEND